MSEIRGEKVKFGRDDIVCLHQLPSARAHEPLVLHCTERPSHLMVLMRFLAGLSAVAALILVLVIGTIESGLVDAPLNARALTALNGAVGPNYAASVEKTVLRFSSVGGLALKAENVALAERASGQNVANAAAVSIVLDPLALLAGRVAPTRLDIDRAMFNPALLPKGPPIDLDKLRLDAVPAYQELAFDRLGEIDGMIARNGLSHVRITNLALPLVGDGGRLLTLAVEHVTFARSATGEMSIDGEYGLDGKAGGIGLVTQANTGGREVGGKISGIPVGAFALRRTAAGEVTSGVDAQADLTLTASHGAGNSAPRLELAVATEGGTLYLDGIGASLKPTRLALHYDYERRSIEISPSEVKVGASTFPFTGGLIDLDRLPNQTEKGFAVDLVVRNAVSAPEDTAEAPVHFDAKVEGRLIPAKKQMLFDQLGVSSPHGSLAGSLGLTFGGKSPEVNFAMVSDRLQAVAVKQLWPYWIAKKARQWVTRNIFGGTVTNGRIEVSMAADREPEPDGRLELGEGELRIDFDIADTRLNIAGAIPPLRDVSGRFALNGGRVDIGINGGTSYMPSGRAVTVNGGMFLMADVHKRPLMADLDIDLAGPADAIAELVTYEPIDVLKRTQFTPDDLSGAAEAKVRARFGLVRDQHPPPPEWNADIKLLGVDLKKPITGRNIADVEGTLTVNPTRADLKAKARIDEVPLEITLVEPVDRSAGLKREMTIAGTIGDRERARLFPGLNDLLSGPVAISVVTDPDGRQKVEANLGRAAVSLPWIGWTKGAGIAATSTFTLDKQDGETRLSGFDFSGDGFAIAGNVVLSGASLHSARFDTVRLSAQDAYSLAIDRNKSGYVVKAQGKSADARPILARLKANPAGSATQDDVPISIRADFDHVTGFNGETLGNVSLTYATNGRRITALDLRGVTASGQALLATMSRGDGHTLELTSGDAGALARLANIYRHMEGGLLNMRLKAGADGSWRGPVDIRKFRLTGEEKLRSMVSTPAGGRSLNEAVRSDIDTSSMHFSRGFAFVVAKQGTLRVENGVVRGEAVGATFQGTVRDASDRMELTGTFMPAYGLNRLFAELPVIGFILGNGSDRGLIGITFKLSGPFDRPGLMVNPLSIIAPGVFRNIFEF
ncbi:MAG TPA: AsmA-like C-terminal region-containing protein [Mycoplana sp.]|nr:AsmA-like C-terminal region-containing protein [Mycoplana sp.]